LILIQRELKIKKEKKKEEARFAQPSYSDPRR